MSTCCIGYYSTISKDFSVIQGAYHEVLNDPIYSRDQLDHILPLQSSAIYKENAPYDAPPDLLAGNGTVMVARGRKQYGSALQTMSSSKRKEGGRYKSRMIHEDVTPAVNEVKKDIRKGAQARERAIQRVKEERKKIKKLARPKGDPMLKISQSKPKLPAQRLKEKLLNNRGRTKIDRMTKRTQIKDLLKRLQ